MVHGATPGGRSVFQGGEFSECSIQKQKGVQHREELRVWGHVKDLQLLTHCRRGTEELSCLWVLSHLVTPGAWGVMTSRCILGTSEEQ